MSPFALLSVRNTKATALIVGLGGERARWTEDSRKFADTKRRLVGDVALSCAFVGYCGPFNQDFRDHLVKTRFTEDLVTRGIPLTKGLDLTSFLVDMGTIGDWNLDGLPTDPLSIQNGILVSYSTSNTYRLHLSASDVVNFRALILDWVSERLNSIKVRGGGQLR